MRSFKKMYAQEGVQNGNDEDRTQNYRGDILQGKAYITGSHGLEKGFPSIG